MKKSIRFLGLFLSVMLAISMLAAFGAPASAAVAGPDAAATYMYRFDRAATSSYSQGFFFDFPDFTLSTGDVYRLSFYYNAPEGSVFSQGFNTHTPLDFALQSASGSAISIPESASLASVDSNWYYMEYTWTVADSLNNLSVQTLILRSLEPIEKNETVYFADIQLCKVTDNVAGANILEGICTSPDLKDWILAPSYGKGTGKTTSTHSDNTLTVMAYDETLFKRTEAIDILGAQVQHLTEKANLRFGFKVVCTGVTYDRATFIANYEDGSVTINGQEYEIASAGALVCRQGQASATEMVVNSANTKVKMVPADKLYDGDAQSIRYTVKITNIPSSSYDTGLVARPYIAYYDGGELCYAYGNTVIRSVSDYEELA